MGKPCIHESLRRPLAMAQHIFSIALGLSVFCVFPGFSAVPAGPGGGKSRLNSLTWVGYFDPARNYLAAKALLQFDKPTDERLLWLAEGLQLNSVRSELVPVMDLNRDPGQFLLKGRNGAELEIKYSGQFVPVQNPGTMPEEAGVLQTEVQLDCNRFLSCINDFYPNAGMDFGSIVLNISIPMGWNCLGSGILRSIQPQPDLTTYVFDNAGAKGMSLVIGHFTELGRLPTAIPVRLHGWPRFNYNWYFPASDIARILAFYHERFGPLDVPEINILFQRGRNFGGKSYCGLVILDVDAAWTSFSLYTRKNIQSDSPLAMFDAKVDVLSHELSHQWWGGLISWNSPAENWITEGLATYSSLISLRAWQGEREYRKSLGQLRRQVKCYAGLGAPAEGYKLLLFRQDPRVYQALVYGKPALMLAALADKIGETELCARLRAILRERRKSNMLTADFLSLLSAGDEQLRAQLDKWICGRELPQGF